MNKLNYFLISVLCFCFFSVMLPSYAADPPLPTPVGRVVWIKGTLKAVMPSKEERILQKTSVIYAHDTLVTDANSQAQIVFTDNTLMTFRPDTKFYIDQYSFNPQAKKGSVGKYFMRLIEGGFRTITGLIAKSNPTDYQINTPVATIGVRGTDYAVYLRGGQMYVGYYQGSPCVTGKDQTLCLSDKQRYAFVPSAGAVPVPLAQQPAVFQEKQEIVPAKIAPFSGGGGSTSVTPRSLGGPITSFCITQ